MEYLASPDLLGRTDATSKPEGGAKAKNAAHASSGFISLVTPQGPRLFPDYLAGCQSMI
jgi:hypothetical protein